jgi:hypothetical protein
MVIIHSQRALNGQSMMLSIQRTIPAPAVSWLNMKKIFPTDALLCAMNASCDGVARNW